MDIKATFNEINSLSVEERIDLVFAIWDSIAVEQTSPNLTEAQKQELDRHAPCIKTLKSYPMTND